MPSLYEDEKSSIDMATLCALAGKAMIQSGYEEAVAHGYLWHEFGDSHLILPG